MFNYEMKCLLRTWIPVMDSEESRLGFLRKKQESYIGILHRHLLCGRQMCHVISQTLRSRTDIHLAERAPRGWTARAPRFPAAAVVLVRLGWLVRLLFRGLVDPVDDSVTGYRVYVILECRRRADLLRTWGSDAGPRSRTAGSANYTHIHTAAAWRRDRLTVELVRVMPLEQADADAFEKLLTRHAREVHILVQLTDLQCLHNQ